MKLERIGEGSIRRSPLLVRGVDATSKKCREATSEGADGVVAHKGVLVGDHPVCRSKVGFADFLLMRQPPLLTRRGLRQRKYCVPIHLHLLSPLALFQVAALSALVTADIPAVSVFSWRS